MNREILTSVLLTLVLAAVVAPTAAPASSRGYSAGHFELVVDGQVVYTGPGELTSANSLVLRGARTAALVSWARGGELRNASLVEYEGTPIVTYSIVNAWPKLHDDEISIAYEHISRD